MHIPPFHQDNALLGQATNDNISSTMRSFCLTSTIFVDSANRVHESRLEPETCLEAEFDLDRLNAIQNLLWWAGRPVPARPLHRQYMLGRQIIITEQIDLHLVRTQSKMFLKPLPPLLLDYDCWSTYICSNSKLYKSACGLLLSYVWLVRYDSDLNIARKCGLLPESITMEAWRVFVSSFLERIDPNALDQVNSRYIYGELRLNRLNQIYRFAPTFSLQHLIFAYGLYPLSYGSFLRRNFGWLLVVFAYASIMLAAFQVGLGADPTRTSSSFHAAAYGFTVFSILTPITAAVIAALLYAALFTFHIVATLRLERARKQEREYALKNKRIVVS